MSKIPVIDLFAGPGGLGEGFSRAGFDLRLSIEMDPVARKTLKLRALFRELRKKGLGTEVVNWLGGERDLEDIEALDATATRAAGQEAWQAKLGEVSHKEVCKRIKAALGDEEIWILLGGPPCQAYSLVGRSRMRSVRKDFDQDERHFLYKEYLRIVADFAPPVFLMENVKGILSSTVKGQRIFHRILKDLHAPGRAVPGKPKGGKSLQYDLRPLVLPDEEESLDEFSNPAQFLVRAENHGVPQKRHRVFVLGIRSDLDLKFGQLEPNESESVSVEEMIRDLPPLRSDLSRRERSGTWESAIAGVRIANWLGELSNDSDNNGPEVVRLVRDASSKARLPLSKVRRKRPLRFDSDAAKDVLEWCGAGSFPVLNHDARSHMRSDLHRYLFAACFAEANSFSPKLGAFPQELLPDHENLKHLNGKAVFDDRFRVQCAHSAATTVTCHISKDGHYFIHHDPLQCRSLTVREAARIQTFPDDYFFCGPRTEQYRQVGNAVPPYLAFQIAKLIKAGLRRENLV